MAVYVSEGSLLSFLEREYTEAPRQVEDTAEGLCLVAGSIAKRNLRDALTRRDIHSQFLSISTIEETAKRVLTGERDQGGRIVSQQFRLMLLRRLVERAQAGDGPEALQELVNGIEFSDELYETLLAELDSYYRSSDAGDDHETLKTLIDTIDDRFVADHSQRALSAFAAATDELQAELADLNGAYLSRSHMVKAAREQIHRRWDQSFPEVEWIAVKTVNVFDNPTLRFFQHLADLNEGPDIYFFFDEGTSDPLRTRFETVGIDIQDVSGHKHSRPEAVDQLVTAATSAKFDAPEELVQRDDVRFVEAPERRREVEQVLRHVERLRKQGVSMADCVVVAENAGTYRAAFDDICTTHGLPFHVETRRPIAQTIPYRYLKAIIDLIAEAAKPAVAQELNYWDVIDPIRHGYCPPTQEATEWPMGDEAFLRLEERLYQAQRDEAIEDDIETGNRTFGEWRSIVDKQTGRPWEQLDAFLSWVEEQARTVPTAGNTIESLFRELLRSQEFHTATRAVRTTTSPIVDAARTDINKKHQAAIVGRLDDALGSLRRYYEDCLELDIDEPSWDLAAQALGQSLGNDSFGLRNNDGNALRIIDAANAYFIEADHVFVLGVTAGDFPQDPIQPTFLHRTVYDTTWKLASNPQDAPDEVNTETLPYLYYPGREFQYRQQLDAYEAGLSVATESVTLVRHYRDSEDYDVAWSPFVDSLPLAEDDQHVEHIALGDWIPGPNWYGDWPQTTVSAPMRDRLRLALFHLRDGIEGDVYHPRLTSQRLDSEADLIRLLSSVDGDAFKQDVASKYDRFSGPITEISVSNDEATFTTGPSFEAVTGEPIRTHELDIYAQCPLKYYFSQFLFGVSGQDVYRDLPETTGQSGSYTYNRVPNVIRVHYATQQTRRSVGSIVGTHLPERQADLERYTAPKALLEDYSDWSETDTELVPEVVRELLGEYFVVGEETVHGIDRNWEWVEDPDPVSVRGYDIKLPSHRRDSIADGDHHLAVFQSGETGGAKLALKHCYESPDSDLRPIDHHEICNQCENREQCSRQTKFVYDHRVRTAAVARIADGGMIIDSERIDPTARRGEVSRAVSEAIEPIAREQNIRTATLDWSKLRQRWRSQMGEMLTEMVPTDGEAVYEQSLEFARNGGCEGCVYRDLCQVPQHVEEGR